MYETPPQRHATLTLRPLGLTVDGVVAGDDINFNVQTVHSPEGEPEFPADLTGYAFQAFVSRQSDDFPLVVFDIEEIDLTIGLVNLSLTSQQTGSLRPGTYRWRFEWWAPGAKKKTVIQHPFEVART
jgi:hypothetical protein